LDCALDLADGEAALVWDNELPSVIQNLLQEANFFSAFVLFPLIDVVDQPHIFSFFEGNLPSRGAKLHRPGFTDEARQSLRTAHPGHYTKVDFGQTDPTAFFFGDSNIAGHGDFQSATDSVAVDGGDNNLRRVFQTHKHFMAVKREVIPEGQGFAGQHIDVSAGGKEFFWLAGDHDRMNVIVEAGIENRRIKLLQKIRSVAVDGWTVDFHYRDAVVDTVFDHFSFCHGSSLLNFFSLCSFQLTGIPTQVKGDDAIETEEINLHMLMVLLTALIRSISL